MGPATRRIAWTVLLLQAFTCLGTWRANASDRPGWSIDLKNYGYQEWKYKTGAADASDVQLAVSSNSVAVAVANPSSATDEDPLAVHRAQWNISLLLFDAATGRLLSKRGPWFGDRPFQLFSTSSGKFVLHLHHYNEANVGETLVLVNPNSGEIKQLALPPSVIGSKPEWNYLLVSSTGRTLLIRQTVQGGVHYKLLETDTLHVFFEWTSPDAYALWTLGLSDAELLAIGRSWGGKRTDAKAARTAL